MLGVQLTRARLLGVLVTMGGAGSVAGLAALYVNFKPQTSSDMAAWVQGFGTIVALFVSIGAGAYAAFVTRRQQRDEWAQRRLDALAGTLARMSVVRTLAVAVHQRLDEAIKNAIPAQRGALDMLDRCIDILMAEIQGSTPGTAVDECSRLLGELIGLREVAIRWSEPGAVGGGSRYELLKTKRVDLLDGVVGRLERELVELRDKAGGR